MITKTEAQKLWTDRDMAAFSEAERRIDAQVKCGGEPTVHADLHGIQHLSRRVRERLVEAYQQGGWVVGIRDGDQRDPGPFVTMS